MGHPPIWASGAEASFGQINNLLDVMDGAGYSFSSKDSGLDRRSRRVVSADYTGSELCPSSSRRQPCLIFVFPKRVVEQVSFVKGRGLCVD